MEFTLHPEAVKDFDAKAAALVERLQSIPDPGAPSGFQPDLHIAAELTTDEIEVVSAGSVDLRGAQVSRSFDLPMGKSSMGLLGPDYDHFAKLVEDIQHREPLRRYVSKRFIADRVFEWIRHASLGTAPSSMCGRLLPECAAALKVLSIWVPVSHFFIEAPWPFGEVEIRPFGRAVFDGIVSQIESRPLSQDTKAIMLGRVERDRRRYQGKAAVVATLEAEQTYAVDLALDLAMEAVDMVRLYHPGQFTANVTCHMDVSGQAPERSTVSFTFSGDVLVNSQEGLSDTSIVGFALSQQSLANLEQLNLSLLSALLRNRKRTDFQELGLEALRRYSRGILAATEEDRLLYVLVAAESVLLRNESEPIQQSIAERMAFFLERQAGGRQTVVRLVKNAYETRSKYVHHGRTIDEEKDLSAFFLVAWRFFIGLIKAIHDFKTRDQFIKALEDAKYS